MCRLSARSADTSSQCRNCASQGHGVHLRPWRGCGRKQRRVSTSTKLTCPPDLCASAWDSENLRQTHKCRSSDWHCDLHDFLDNRRKIESRERNLIYPAATTARRSYIRCLTCVKLSLFRVRLLTGAPSTMILPEPSLRTAIIPSTSNVPSPRNSAL